jgi:hypothetical protein
MIAKHNKTSLVIGVSGIILQYGSAAFLWGFPNFTFPGVLLGTLLITIGLAYYLKAKARSLGFLFLGIIPVFGLVALALLSDRSKQCPARSA